MRSFSNIEYLSFSLGVLSRKVSQSFKGTRESLIEIQLKKLRSIALGAYTTVPFYRKLYSQHGLCDEKIQNLEHISQLPIVKKEDLLAAGNDIFSESKSILAQPIFRNTTSGTSGDRLVLEQNMSTIIARALSYQSAYGKMMNGYMPWHKLMYVYTSPHPFRNLLGFYRNEFCSTLGSVKSIKSTLMRFQPSILSIYPSILRELTSEMLDDELSEVREKLIAISTNSEASSEEERLDLAQVWGVPVFDEYSTEEVPGVLASQSHCRSYHVHEEYCIAERVKVNSASEPNSDMGKLIVTSLIHSNTPIIRYEQGDFVQFESESVCSCGQKGLRIKAFLGRENDSFLLYDGGIVPSGRLLDIGYTILLEHSSIKSWKMRQTRLDCIVFEYASDIEMLAHEITDIKNIISSNIDNSIKVNLKRVIEIEKAQSGKLNQVVREF